MTILRHAALAALPLLAGSAIAQTPAPKAPAPVAAKPATPPVIPGMSPQGSQLAFLKMHANDAALKQLFLQLREVSQQIQLESQRPTINVDLLTTLVRKLDTLQVQFHGKQTDNILTTLQALPPADRGPFLKAIGLGAKPAAAGAPAPGAAPAH